MIGTELQPRKLVLVVAGAGFVLATVLLGVVLAFEKKEVRTTTNTVTKQTPAKQFSTTINQPEGPPCIHVQTDDQSEGLLTVACSTCHANREPNTLNREPKDLDEFHQDMVFDHGSLSCLSCHNANDYDTLKAADGASIAYTEVMQLCGQCHGPQMRDYTHGAHGGMTGYWDLNRGPRQRNNCVDCHHPHAPQFPHMQPTFKPRDRFLSDSSDPQAKHHE